MAEIAAGAAQGKRVEIWFEDEARIGQKDKIAPRGQAGNAAFRAA